MIHPNTRRILNKAKRHAAASRILNHAWRMNRDALRSYYAATQNAATSAAQNAAQNAAQSDQMSIWRR